ncbi:MAG TPA: cytochrome bc complex cytochrome b subunit [Herpetosiphonaceae bacterium]
MATRPARRPEGPAQRIKGALVEASRSIFPSMGAAEWRSVIRGEPAPRPNPRMRVHSNSFWYHIRPRALPLEATAWYYTFGLGWMSFFFFMLEAITGAILMVYYTPSPLQAYADMQKIISDVPLGRLLRNMHRLGAHFMVAVVILHMMRTYFTASYKAPRQFIWVTGIILLIMTLVLSFSGYLLPWDQLAYWAVTIGSSMADAAPLFGSAANLLLRGGVDIGAGTLLRFYLLHVFALPALTILFISIHYYAVRKQELSPIHELFAPDNPRGWGKPTKRKVPFLPDQVFFEIALIVLLTFAFVAINYFFWDAKLESHANPGVTPQHTKAPWYFLWLQGMLKFGDKIVFGLILGPLVLVLPILLPYMDRNPSRRFADRKVAVASGIIAMVFFGFVTYAGLPEYGIQQSGSQEILTEFVPIEGEGIVDHVPWSALPNTPVVYEVKAQNGTVDSGTITDLNGNVIDENTLTEETRHLFEEFRGAIQHWVTVDNRFVNPTAKLSIEPWTYVTNDEGQVVNAADGQPAVAIKKATVVLDFQSTEIQEGNPVPVPLTNEDGTPQISTSEQADFLHRDSHEDQLEENASAPREASQ